jgi:hypothetical protein
MCDPHSVIIVACRRRSATLPVQSGLGQLSPKKSGQGEDTNLPIMLHGGTRQHFPPVNLPLDPDEFAVMQHCSISSTAV